jgi:putative transcriptional regulator
VFLKSEYLAIKMVSNITLMTNNRPYNRIKAVLAEKGKTNLWLADELGKNKTTVSKWCTNDVQPPIETLFKIADVLAVNVRELLVSNGK